MKRLGVNKFCVFLYVPFGIEESEERELQREDGIFIKTLKML